MIRDFPHTVCVEEMKTIVTVQEAERMDKKRKRTKGTLPDDGIRRYLYFAAIPVVVLILVVVILHSDKKKDAGQTEAVAMTAETGQPVGLNEGDPAVDESSAADSSKYTLKQDEMPELTALVQSYCQAKTDCDPEALQQLFGVTDLSEDQIAAEREKMELVKASIKAYKNISCYYIEGAEADSYVIFPYFEIQYLQGCEADADADLGVCEKTGRWPVPHGKRAFRHRERICEGGW